MRGFEHSARVRCALFDSCDEAGTSRRTTAGRRIREIQDAREDDPRRWRARARTRAHRSRCARSCRGRELRRASLVRCPPRRVRPTSGCAAARATAIDSATATGDSAAADGRDTRQRATRRRPELTLLPHARALRSADRRPPLAALLGRVPGLPRRPELQERRAASNFGGLLPVIQGPLPGEGRWELGRAGRRVLDLRSRARVTRPDQHRLLVRRSVHRALGLVLGAAARVPPELAPGRRVPAARRHRSR